jgi:LPXTG-site transpeptidase (sortase) family protein
VACLGTAAAVVATSLLLGSTAATETSDAESATTTVAPTPSDASSRTVAQALKRSPPTGIKIPAIGLTSSLMKLGLTADGSLEVPPGATPAGWFTGAPTPGELGPAIVAGHISYNGIDGVFHDLHSLDTGDKVFVDRRDGKVATFRVTRIESFEKSKFPSELVYGNVDDAALRLITCDNFNADTGAYRSNLVVFATLI